MRARSDLSGAHKCNDNWKRKGSQTSQTRGYVGVTQMNAGVMVETTHLRPRQRLLPTDRVNSGEYRSLWICHRIDCVVLPASKYGAIEYLGKI
jgi:hypothetical protein